MIPADVRRISDQCHVAEPAMERILVVDNDRVIQRALKRFFESEGYIVDARSDGEAGLKAFYCNPPTAVILDLRLPLISGQEVCRVIRRVSLTVPVIVVSAVADLVHKIRLLELGADDYVTKPFSPRELLARVRAAIRHASMSDNSNLASFDGVSVDFLKMNASLDGKPVRLTTKEFKLVKYFVQRPERVLSREEILRDALGYHDPPYSRAVDCHVLKLRQKLERDPANPVHFRAVPRMGYRFVP